jgi:putative alpha-1,2-mannosidase
MHNDTLRRAAPPIATVTSASTAIYNPPSDGFPFVAVVFSPDGATQAFRAFPNRRDAEGFLQAFMQEGAGEYGLG